MGIPASFEILRNWSVKPLRKDVGQKNKNKTEKFVHVLVWASIC